ncbi:hypothetical protein A4A49_16205 [Nicotiana attenuata]|uniref:Uncharacterized protein n=1 Tax=Nicotiana attenuata TaxID=49451 RepID=A0A314L4D3_NICAT|nr:hypothetical protein A4A49_16205 [Nicotiana attenuata]
MTMKMKMLEFNSNDMNPVEGFIQIESMSHQIVMEPPCLCGLFFAQHFLPKTMIHSHIDMTDTDLAGS